MNIKMEDAKTSWRYMVIFMLLGVFLRTFDSGPAPWAGTAFFLVGALGGLVSISQMDDAIRATKQGVRLTTS